MNEPPSPSRFARFKPIGSEQPEASRFTLLSGWLSLILVLAIVGAVAGPIIYWFFEMWRAQPPHGHLHQSALWRAAHQNLIDHPVKPADLDRRLQLSALTGGLLGVATGAGCWLASLLRRNARE